MVALKAAHPGVLLLVEVGYKMRMFGQDAEVAAKVRRSRGCGLSRARCQLVHSMHSVGVTWVSFLCNIP